MSGSKTDILISLADIREEARVEEWEQAHPLRNRLGKFCIRQKARALDVWKWFRATGPGESAVETVDSLQRRCFAAKTSVYLTFMRVFRLYLPKESAEELSISQLKFELDCRFLDHSECVEKEELIKLLANISIDPEVYTNKDFDV